MAGGLCSAGRIDSTAFAVFVTPRPAPPAGSVTGYNILYSSRIRIVCWYLHPMFQPWWFVPVGLSCFCALAALLTAAVAGAGCKPAGIPASVHVCSFAEAGCTHEFSLHRQGALTCPSKAPTSYLASVSLAAITTLQLVASFIGCVLPSASLLLMACCKIHPGLSLSAAAAVVLVPTGARCIHASPAQRHA